jgi:enhancer of mRNA-decapping protein 3
VTLLWSGQRFPTYHIDAPGIADLEVSSTQLPQSGPGSGHIHTASTAKQHENLPQIRKAPLPGPQVLQPTEPIPVETAQETPPQPFHDPAILSFSKPPPKLNTQAAPLTNLQNLSRSASNGSQATQTFPTPSNPAYPSRASETHDSDVTAILTEPFSHVSLKEETKAEEKSDYLPQEVLEGSVPEGRKGAAPLEAPVKYTGKRSRRGGRSKGQKDPNAPFDAINENEVISAQNLKGNGWRQTAFVEPMRSQEANSKEYLTPEYGKRRKARNRKSYAEDHNGWATEDATDIQEMGDFDFQGNLSKFDKRRVFEEIRNDDTTADEDRLVSFNRRPQRPGTNGGKNLHWSENVLDSPTPKWNSEAGETDTEISDDNENYSGRDRSRASARAQPSSRKGSGALGQILISTQLGPVARTQISLSRNPSPFPGKQSVSASPMNGPISVTAGSLRLTTTNRSCPTVSPLQMLEVEQLAVTELGLSEDMITENAGRGIAEAAVAQLSSDTAAPTVLVLTGNHRTGGRAISAARHLRNRGHRVTLCVLGLEHETELLESCRKQLEIFKKIGGRVLRWEELSARLSTSDLSADLVVDALFGMHIAFEELRTDDQAAAFEMISWVNRSNLSVISVDVPSGISAASGK